MNWTILHWTFWYKSNFTVSWNMYIHIMNLSQLYFLCFQVQLKILHYIKMFKCILLSLLAFSSFSMADDRHPSLVGGYQTNEVTADLARSAGELVRGALASYQPSGTNAPRTDRQMVKLIGHRTQRVAGTNTEIRGYFKDTCGGQVRVFLISPVK